MKLFYFLIVSVVIQLACQKKITDLPAEIEQERPNLEESAIVLSVSTSGSANQYSFNVEVKSPDTGCDQYANWWEVVSPEGELLYRRILGHSHVNEQPFKRSGGPVPVSAMDSVIVRAHMNNLGYGIIVQTGSVHNGFQRDTINEEFASNLESAEPQPGTCPF